MRRVFDTSNNFYHILSLILLENNTVQDLISSTAIAIQNGNYQLECFHSDILYCLRKNPGASLHIKIREDEYCIYTNVSLEDLEYYSSQGVVFYNFDYKDKLSSFDFKLQEISSLLDNKNQQYGSAYLKVPEIMKILYPEGIPSNQYSNVLTLIRMLDKICRIAHDNGNDPEDPWMDLAGYALLKLKD